MNSPASIPHPVRLPQQSFQAVIITLSAALLVFVGMVIGRVVVTAQADEVVDHFDAELTALRTELVDLNRQLVQAESRSVRAEESTDRYRQLATQERVRADKLEIRQLGLNQMIGNVLRDRQVCLGELQQHVALDQFLPAGDVLRFAEEMFDAQTQTLQYLAGGADVPARPLSARPRLHVGEATADLGPKTTRNSGPAARSSVATAAADGPRLPLPAPTAKTTRSSVPPARRSGGAFFESPRRKPGQYTFFSARRSGSMVTLPRSSGITFLDTADADEGDSVRR